LSQVLAYQNDAIVHKFCEGWPVDFDEANGIFHETKKWLWFCASSSAPSSPFQNATITDELRIIDEMWHTFILFTREYDEFCTRYFGAFIHHAPTTKDEKETFDRDAFLAHKREQYSVVYDLLGADTLSLWYLGYKERYGSAFFARPGALASRTAERPKRVPARRSTKAAGARA
jgi:hypothetical protein